MASLLQFNNSRPIQQQSGLIGTSAYALPPAKFEQEVVEWAERASRQAQEQDATSPTIKLIPKIIQYLGGQQWPSRPTAYGSSRPVTNKMFRQYWEVVSLLTDAKPEPQIKIYDNIDGYSELQAIIGKLLEVWANKPGYHDALQDIIGFGLMAYGIGKVQWNSALSGGMGDVELLSVNPLAFHRLGGDGSIEQAELVIEDQISTIASLVRRYGDLARYVEPDANLGIASIQTMKPSQLSTAEWSKMAPNIRRLMGVKQGGQNDNLYPMAKVRQYWMWDPAVNERSETVRVGKSAANWSYLVEPGMPLYPRGRLLVVAGKKVLDDTCNPYFHATFPYIDMTPLKTGWSKEGMSLMGNQIGPQDIVNRLTAGLLETIKASLIPTIITPRNAISRADLDNMSTTISGGKLEYNPNSANPPKFRDAPQFPVLAMQFTEMTKAEMDMDTGSAAINAAAQKQQIPSHDTMELIQNSRSSMVRVLGRAVEGFLNRGGQMVVANMLQFYSVGHRVAILGEKGITSQDFQPMYGSLVKGGMAPEIFVRRFEFSVKPGSALSFDKETKIQMASVLRLRGDLSRNNLFRALDANIDLAQNEAELKQEAVEKIQVALLGSAAASAGKQMVQGGGAAGPGAGPGAGGPPPPMSGR